MNSYTRRGKFVHERLVIKSRVEYKVAAERRVRIEGTVVAWDSWLSRPCWLIKPVNGNRWNVVMTAAMRPEIRGNKGEEEFFITSAVAI